MNENLSEFIRAKVNEETCKELLSQEKWLEAIQHVIDNNLPFSDEELIDAVKSLLKARDRAREAGNQEEVSRLEAEYDEIDKLRMG